MDRLANEMDGVSLLFGLGDVLQGVDILKNKLANGVGNDAGIVVGKSSENVQNALLNIVVLIIERSQQVREVLRLGDEGKRSPILEPNRGRMAP